MTFHPHPLQVLAPNNAPLQIQTLDQKLATIESLGIPLGCGIPFDMQLAQIERARFCRPGFVGKAASKGNLCRTQFCLRTSQTGKFQSAEGNRRRKGFLGRENPSGAVPGNRVSSTAIRQALVSGQVGLARRLLDRPLRLTGTIIQGRDWGRSWRFQRRI